MTINEIITAYLAAKEEETAAKKRAAAMKELILAHAGGQDNFRTDIYTVVIKATESVRLDTARLYADFPDIKNEYGKASTSKTVNAVRTADEDSKTA